MFLRHLHIYVKTSRTDCHGWFLPTRSSLCLWCLPGKYLPFLNLCVLLAAIFLFVGCAAPPPKTANRIAVPAVSTAAVTETRKSVIIYPPGFEESAAAFAYLHREFGGVEAILVPLSEIDAGQAIDGSLRHISYAGWDNQRPEKISIKNYNFLLVKKIISRLLELQKKEKILAVLLLGDGGLVPPSYYFHLPFLNTFAEDDRPYNEWIASDLLYGSPDLDLQVDWAVGRISVDSPDQAMKVAEKYYRWNLEKKNRAPDGFIFFSGNIRKDLVYSGEIFYMMMEREGIVGSKARHYFQSDGRYTVNHLRKSFAKDPGNIHFIFTHGSGDGFAIDDDVLYSQEIMEMDYKPGLPLIVSPSCLDGGFDYDLISPPHDRHGLSIAEAILRSDGAGIGYLGSSRISLGQFHFTMVDGFVDAERMYYRYMPGLINDFLRAWHGGNHRIADAYIEAHQRYRKRFPSFDTQDLATFVELNLLADPVMFLPEPVKSEKPPFFEHLHLASPHILKQRKPFVPPEQTAIFTLNSESPYRMIHASIVEAVSGEIIVKKQTVTPDLPLTVEPEKKKSYLIRLEMPGNTIGWQFFHSGQKQDFE